MYLTCVAHRDSCAVLHLKLQKDTMSQTTAAGLLQVAASCATNKGNDDGFWKDIRREGGSECVDATLQLQHPFTARHITTACKLRLCFAPRCRRAPYQLCAGAQIWQSCPSSCPCRLRASHPYADLVHCCCCWALPPAQLLSCWKGERCRMPHS